MMAPKMGANHNRTRSSASTNTNTPQNTESSSSEQEQEQFRHHTIIIKQPLKHQPLQQQNNNNTSKIIIISAILCSSLSSILHSTLQPKLKPAVFPTLELFSLAIITRIPQLTNPLGTLILKNNNNNNNNSQTATTPPPQITTNQATPPSSSSSASASSSTLSNTPQTINLHSRFTKWRLLIKFTLPIALLQLISSWSKAQITQRLNCSTWQAFDLYSLPIAITVLTRLPSITRSSPELFPILSILTFTISLLIFHQSLYAHVILIALVSPIAQALYLIHLKTWLLSFPQLNPVHLLAYSSPFSLLFILLPILFNLLTQNNPLGLIPRISLVNTLTLILYTLIRLIERFVELWAVHRFHSPLSLLLILPARNLLSILIAPLVHLRIGPLGSHHAVLVYGFAIWAICHSHHPNRLSHLFTSLLPSSKPQQSDHDRRRSSTSILTNQLNNYRLETIREKSARDTHHHHHHAQPSSPKYRQHHRLSLGHQRDHPHHSQPAEDHPPRRKSLPERLMGANETEQLKPHWQTFFWFMAFGTLPLAMILRWMMGAGGEMMDEGVVLTTGGAQLAGRPRGSLDLVFSYYNEPLGSFSEVVDYVRRESVLATQNPRVVVYVKDPQASLATIGKTVEADEVIRLANVGREGGTYLTHILRHYNASAGAHSKADVEALAAESQYGLERWPATSPVWGLADHTVFMQPEIAWSWIAKPRLTLFNPQSTGFLSLGPYLVSVCGQDGLGNGNYERMRDIYTLFHDSFCPPTGQLASYAGQFVVSRRRIVANGWSKYAAMRALLEAAPGHWIHGEGGWLKWKGATDDSPAVPNGPVAPFLGHALERSWPVVFHCHDPALAASCPDHLPDKAGCQCYD